MHGSGDPFVSQALDDPASTVRCEDCGLLTDARIDNPVAPFVPVPGKEHTFVRVHLNCPGDASCQVRSAPGCSGRFHPSTGYLVGQPSQFRACGPCARFLLGDLKFQGNRWVRGYLFSVHAERPGPDVGPDPGKQSRKWRKERAE